MDYKIYAVMFKNSSITSYFKANIDLKKGDDVIVQSARGLEYGKIDKLKDDQSNIDDYNEIIRLATDEDTSKYYKNLKDEQNAVIKCKEFVDTLGLQMNIINASFTLDRSQLLINFTADERVDFRQLAKSLAGVYRTRIELRQIGARDKAKEVGGIGVCGQKLCCLRFLNQIDSISMNKAKNQGLALNPSKINGLCGRLLCCLCYEDEEYSRCQKGLKSVGSKIILDDKSEGKIIAVDILQRKYTVLVNDEKKIIFAKDLHDGNKK